MKSYEDVILNTSSQLLLCCFSIAVQRSIPRLIYSLEPNKHIPSRQHPASARSKCTVILVVFKPQFQSHIIGSADDMRVPTWLSEICNPSFWGNLDASSTYLVWCTRIVHQQAPSPCRSCSPMGLLLRGRLGGIAVLLAVCGPIYRKGKLGRKCKALMLMHQGHR